MPVAGYGQMLNPAMLADLVMAQAAQAQAKNAGRQLDPAELTKMALELLRAPERLPGIAPPQAVPPRGVLPGKAPPPGAFPANAPTSPQMQGPAAMTSSSGAACPSDGAAAANALPKELRDAAAAAAVQMGKNPSVVQQAGANMVPLPTGPRLPLPPGALLAPGVLQPRPAPHAGAWLHAGPQLAPAGITTSGPAPSTMPNAAGNQADSATLKPPFVSLVEDFCRRALGPESDAVYG